MDENKITNENENDNNVTPTTDTESQQPLKSSKSKANGINSDVFRKFQQMVKVAEHLVENAELELKRAKLILHKVSTFDPEKGDVTQFVEENKETIGIEATIKSDENQTVQVIEWHFDGYFMLGKDNKKYPVPLNYASKTKLVPGDHLKLKILEDGKLIYKLIEPVERKHLKAVLSKSEENKFVAITDDGNNFFLNQAAVTFFKGRPGDELYIITNKEWSGAFAAIEAIIKK